MASTPPPKGTAPDGNASNALSELRAAEALLAALDDNDASVRAAALRALEAHEGPASTALLHERLSDLLHATSTPALRSHAPDGPPDLATSHREDATVGLLELIARRCFAAIEGELFSWWPAHPVLAIQEAAARALLAGGRDNALAVLRIGLPDGNGDAPLRNTDGALRSLMPLAADVIVADDPARAFNDLSPFLEGVPLLASHGAIRAEAILTSVLALTPSSGVALDPRWCALGVRLASACGPSSSLRALAERFAGLSPRG